MCNRYHLDATADELIEMFELVRDVGISTFVGAFYPGKRVPVVRQHKGVRRIEQMTWGFPPFKGKRPINNTRSEQASGSPFWRPHLGQRCVFPISQAIEWQHQVDTRTGELLKVPHSIRFRDGRLAAVAGIYGADGQDSYCSMMTCRANRFWSQIHNAKPDDPRMVCFLLDSQAIADWLDVDQSYEAVKCLLRPLPDAQDLLVATSASSSEPDGRGAERAEGPTDEPGLFR